MVTEVRSGPLRGEINHRTADELVWLRQCPFPPRDDLSRSVQWMSASILHGT